MMQELVSVIVPVYNVEQYLQKCIDSIVKQTYQNLEIILIDDGSTDSSGAICDDNAERDNRIRVVHQQNGGLAKVRNVGLDICTGDFVVFVDSDDFVEPDYVEYLYRLLQDNHADISGCEFRFHTIDGKVINHYRNDGTVKVLDQREALRELCNATMLSCSMCAKMFRRAVFENIRTPEGHLFEDLATTYRLFMKADKIAFGYRIQYHYLIRSGSIMTQVYDSRRMDAILFAEQMCAAIRAKYPDLTGYTHKRLFSEYTFLFSFVSGQEESVCDKRGLTKALFPKIRETRMAALLHHPTNRQLFYAVFSLLGIHGLRLGCYIERELLHK